MSWTRSGCVERPATGCVWSGAALCNAYAWAPLPDAHTWAGVPEEGDLERRFEATWAASLVRPQPPVQTVPCCLRHTVPEASLLPFFTFSDVCGPVKTRVPARAAG